MQMEKFVAISLLRLAVFKWRTKNDRSLTFFKMLILHCLPLLNNIPASNELSRRKTQHDLELHIVTIHKVLAYSLSFFRTQIRDDLCISGAKQRALKATTPVLVHFSILPLRTLEAMERPMAPLRKRNPNNSASGNSLGKEAWA